MKKLLIIGGSGFIGTNFCKIYNSGFRTMNPSCEFRFFNEKQLGGNN